LLLILDIDGTIANGEHRVHLIDGTPEGWTKFLSPELVKKDAPIVKAQKCIAKLIKIPNIEIVFLTGRNEGLRTVTNSWIRKHFGIYNATLIMRPLGDERTPTEYKSGQLRVLRKIYKCSWMAFDDDKYMMPIYEKFGAICFHAPTCWDTMYPEFKNLPKETNWRK
jgi:hypothetical protein